jgi:ATP-binding cassette, subfamily C, bacterial
VNTEQSNQLFSEKMKFLNVVKSLFTILGERRNWSIAIILAMFIASMTEAIGLAAALPLLALLIGTDAGTNSELADIATKVFELLSLPMNPIVIVTFIVFVLTAKICIQLGARILINVTSTELEAATREKLLRAVTEARPNFLVDQHTGEYVNSIISEVSMYARLYRSSCGFFSSIFSIVVYLTLSILASWEATIAATFFGFLIFMSLNFLIGVTRRAATAQADSMANMAADLSDGMSNIKALKAMAAESAFAGRVINHIQKVRKATLRVAISVISLNQAREAATILLVLPGFVAAIYFLDENFETLLILALLFSRTLNAFGTIQTGYQNLISSQPFAAKATKRISDARAAHETSDGTRVPVLTDGISAKHISFSYGEHKVLSTVSLTITSPGITALVGPSGSGKTTMADLILGFIEPDSGQITIDGVPLTDINMNSWRHLIGYVPQELLLFHDSIYNNIALFDTTITETAVEEALRAADAWSFVSAMPGGTQSIVGERGTKLSGGQRQRLSLARALARNPNLLILDEPTTALDKNTEQEICQTLLLLKKKMTILAISHQPAIIEIADAVFTLDHGIVHHGDAEPSKVFASLVNEGTTDESEDQQSLSNGS